LHHQRTLQNENGARDSGAFGKSRDIPFSRDAVVPSKPTAKEPTGIVADFAFDRSPHACADAFLESNWRAKLGKTA
jgi:hypothetical protein